MERGAAEKTEKIGQAMYPPGIYILQLNPRVRASVAKRAKNDSHFYSRAEDEYKAGRIHFSYADTSERKSGNGPERFRKIHSVLVKIDRQTFSKSYPNKIFPLM